MRIHRVQADHATRGYNTDHPVPENRLLRPIEGDEAGCFRFQEAYRLSRMVILLAVGCGIIYSVGKLIFSLWS